LHRADTLRRFRNEQQALAALQHPDIVTLIDGGVADDGVPYLVMDYVDGLPLDEYCRVNGLSVGARVGLMTRVLDAVQHAHGRMFVHCDLKFSNILVTRAGEPKLLDFGLAKILNPEQYGLPVQATNAAVRPFTPEFASPEQLRGEPLTIATDVYSAGVILYWLVTGVHPFETLREDPIALLKAICDAPPPPPVRESADLDAVLAQALRKEPDRRYLTAGRFADDLRRLAGNRPVEARRGSRAYRARKFIQRNRAAAAVAVIVTLAALAGVMSTLWQNYRAQRAHTVATRRLSEARRLTDTLLFDVSDSLRKLPGSEHVQAQVNQWAREYLRSLSRHGISDAAAERRLADLEKNEQR
jgi:serine/threonine protein kinase